MANVSMSQYYSVAVQLADMLTLIGIKASPLTFLHPVSSNQQFQVFLKTAVFLLDRCGTPVSINKYDDPLAVSTSVMMSAKSLNLHLPSFPPVALRTGAGEAVTAFLHALASKALEIGTLSLPSPRIETNSAARDESDNFEANDIGAEEPFSFPSLPSSVAISQQQPAATQNKVFESEWLQEVERASVRLGREASEASTTSLGGRVAEMGERLKCIGNERKYLDPGIAAMKEEVNRFFETVEQEERAAQEMFRSNGLAERARSNRLQLKQLTLEINSKQDKVHSLEEELKFLDENLEMTKNELDDWSDVATDTQPVVKIKEAIKRIKEETKAMDLRIAVLNHTLYEARTKRLFLQ